MVTELGAGVTSRGGRRSRARHERARWLRDRDGRAGQPRVPGAGSLTDGQAATFMQSYMTAYFALVNAARVQPGQWLLVLGAGGGVGLAAVDVGRALGCR